MAPRKPAKTAPQIVEMPGQKMAVGFGIASPEQARRAARVADGVIVGSRIVQLLKQDESYSALRDFIVSLRQALG